MAVELVIVQAGLIAYTYCIPPLIQAHVFTPHMSTSWKNTCFWGNEKMLRRQQILTLPSVHLRHLLVLPAQQRQVLVPPPLEPYFSDIRRWALLRGFGKHLHP